jgi:hypothetical protein
VQKRIEAINSFFVFELYTNVCRSLFEQDKLLFSFSVACALAQSVTKTLDPAAYRFFLTGGISTTKCSTNPVKWLPDKQWAEVVQASELFPEFATLVGAPLTSVWHAYATTHWHDVCVRKVKEYRTLQAMWGHMEASIRHSLMLLTTRQSHFPSHGKRTFPSSVLSSLSAFSAQTSFFLQSASTSHPSLALTSFNRSHSTSSRAFHAHKQRRHFCLCFRLALIP